MSVWVKTVHRGIRYREHESRKVGRVQKDKYYAVRFQVRGKVVETGIGWMSEGVTIHGLTTGSKRYWKWKFQT